MPCSATAAAVLLALLAVAAASPERQGALPRLGGGQASAQGASIAEQGSRQ